MYRPFVLILSRLTCLQQSAPHIPRRPRTMTMACDMMQHAALILPPAAASFQPIRIMVPPDTIPNRGRTNTNRKTMPRKKVENPRITRNTPPRLCRLRCKIQSIPVPLIVLLPICDEKKGHSVISYNRPTFRFLQEPLDITPRLFSINGHLDHRYYAQLSSRPRSGGSELFFGRAVRLLFTTTAFEY